jgi:hypothetical protein
MLLDLMSIGISWLSKLLVILLLACRMLLSHSQVKISCTFVLLADSVLIYIVRNFLRRWISNLSPHALWLWPIGIWIRACEMCGLIIAVISKLLSFSCIRVKLLLLLLLLSNSYLLVVCMGIVAICHNIRVIVLSWSFSKMELLVSLIELLLWGNLLLRINNLRMVLTEFQCFCKVVVLINEGRISSLCVLLWLFPCLAYHIINFIEMAFILLPARINLIFFLLWNNQAEGALFKLEYLVSIQDAYLWQCGNIFLHLSL